MGGGGSRESGHEPTMSSVLLVGWGGWGWGGFPGGGNMASQSRDNIPMQAPREEHKNPPRHYPCILSCPIRSHSPLSHFTHT